jgi:hypothetical protein
VGRTRATLERGQQLLVNFGCEILRIVPGRVSAEVNARLSFDTEGTLAKARKFIAMYKQAGIDRERVLVKIASTWEGIRAAEVLEREGIHCNLTLCSASPRPSPAPRPASRSSRRSSAGSTTGTRRTGACPTSRPTRTPGSRR